MKTIKAPRLSDVSLELIAASGGVGIQVMAGICQNPRRRRTTILYINNQNHHIIYQHAFF